MKSKRLLSPGVSLLLDCIAARKLPTYARLLSCVQLRFAAIRGNLSFLGQFPFHLVGKMMQGPIIGCGELAT